MLKVLTFCNHPVYMCFYKALSELGVWVAVVDLPWKYPIIMGEMDQYANILKALEEVQPDVILTVGRPQIHMNFEHLIQACREKGLFHVYWATEDWTYHDKLSLKIAARCDFIFTPAAECLDDYLRIGKPCALLQFGYSPLQHRHLPPKDDYVTDITIAASYHQRFEDDYVKNFILGQENDGEIDLRLKSIQENVLPLIERKYKVAIWGQGWETLVPKHFIKGLLSYDDVPLLYSSAKIVLGLEWDNISETKTTGRPFEVLGCRGFFLSYRTKALENLFIDRTHLALTSSPRETLEIVDYYLKHDKERQQVALEGQKEVFAKHTYHHRARAFVEALRPYVKG
ncbi:MAG: glycosyltransferase [Desulfosporosinus sp.]|nr:glycosyltransferase [Desulfosporosinus sp.]